MNSVHGRYVHIDLNTGRSERLPIPVQVHRDLLGGIGLGTWLLFQWCSAGTQPYDPEAPLVLASSPFIGTGITTSSKLAVLARSPQTGFIGDSLTSSYLSIALKRAGVDAIVITGRCAGWSTLIVDDEQIHIERADDMLGLSPNQTTDALKARHGNAFRVASIGVAGERLVRYAAVSNDGRLAGRTGIGAVMGSKQLKAMALRGTGRLPGVADAAALGRAARELSSRSQGPETAKYRELGTAANLAFFNRMSMLPSRNFQSSRMDGLEALHGEQLLLERQTDRNACAACTIGCEHHYLLRSNGNGGEKSVRLEYESLYALGPLCGVNDPDVVLAASDLCDQLGMDTISTGATIAWAMECREAGIDHGVAPDQIPAFGDGPALLETVERIGKREGIGDLLAEGSRLAAERVGQGSERWTMHAKGLELPGYDPRKLPTLALGLAVATRGACHNRSSAYEVDLSSELAPDVALRERAGAAIRAEDQAAILDSLTICKFLRHCFGDLPAESAELFRLVTGFEMTGEDLLRAGTRINTLKKLFNSEHGWKREDDRLPARVLDGTDTDSVLNPLWLDDAIEAYYRERGWHTDGIVSDRILQDLKLDFLTSPLPAR